MAWINDNELLNLERARLIRNNILINKGSTQEIGLTDAQMIPMFDSLTSEEEISNLLSGVNMVDYVNNKINNLTGYAFSYTVISHLLLKNVIYGARDCFSNSHTTTIILPNLTSVSDAFANGTIYNSYLVAPKLTNGTFYYGFVSSGGCCPNFILPNFNSSTKGIFSNTNTTSLKFLDITYQATFSGLNNSNIETIILRSNTIVPLSSVTYFTNTNNCTIYVPEDLVSEYEQASNWSNLVAQGKVSFVALEGSKYESKAWFMQEQWYIDEETYWQNKYQDPNFHIIDDMSWAEEESEETQNE